MPPKGVCCPSSNLDSSLISTSGEGTGIYRLGGEIDVVSGSDF